MGQAALFIDGLLHDVGAAGLLPAGLPSEELSGFGQDVPARGDIEDDPMDGLENEGLIVEIDQLDQSVAERGGQDGTGISGRLLGFFPDGFGRGQRMVAVAHGIEKDGCPGGQPGAGGERRRVGQALQGLDDFGFHSRVGDAVSGQPAGSEHQLEVVELGHPGFSLGQGAQDGVSGVVDEDHDVGQLDGRAFADPDPGRDTVEDRPFRGPDQRRRAFSEIVGLQVEGGHEAPARLFAGRAFHVHAAFDAFKEPFGHIPPHRIADAGDAVFGPGLVEIDLGIDQVEGRGGRADERGGPVPVFRFRGVLVAGDDRPFGQIGPFSGQEDIGDLKADGIMNAHQNCSLRGADETKLCLKRDKVRKENRKRVRAAGPGAPAAAPAALIRDFRRG